jgi:UV DNA damage endonuclease
MNTILREQKPPVFMSRGIVLKTIYNSKIIDLKSLILNNLKKIIEITGYQKGQGKKVLRALIIEHFKEISKLAGIEKIKELVIKNLEDGIKLLEWNKENNIYVMRLSSEIFPHKTNPKIIGYDYDFAIPYLKKLGSLANHFKHRLTFHPGQFNVIGTADERIFKQTLLELKHHADLLDLMEMGKDSVMVIHGGGVYGDKEKTIKRWIENFNRLPVNVQSRLVLENCEKSYNIEDCLYISSKVNIPVVFDTHHYDCYNILHPDHRLKQASDYIPDILKTWTKRGIRPKFHVSEQAEGGRVGKHSDYIENLPTYLLEIPKKYNLGIDIMIEAKMKEQAILKLYSKYPELNK